MAEEPTYGGTLTWTEDAGRCTSSCYWRIDPDGGARLYWGFGDVIRDMATLRARTSPDVQILTWSGVPDSARQAIIAAGWAIPYATHAEQVAADAATWARIDANLRAQREARSGGQRLDATPPCSDPITPEVDQLRVDRDGHAVIACRIRSAGYGALEDSDIEMVLREQGAEIHYAADALSAGAYVGTITVGALTEICYDLGGGRHYMYVVGHSLGDTWYQAWWVSGRRYTAAAAADIIEAAQRLAHHAATDREEE